MSRRGDHPPENTSTWFDASPAPGVLADRQRPRNRSAKVKLRLLPHTSGSVVDPGRHFPNGRNGSPSRPSAHDRLRRRLRLPAFAHPALSGLVRGERLAVLDRDASFAHDSRSARNPQSGHSLPRAGCRAFRSRPIAPSRSRSSKLSTASTPSRAWTLHLPHPLALATRLPRSAQRHPRAPCRGAHSTTTRRRGSHPRRTLNCLPRLRTAADSRPSRTPTRVKTRALTDRLPAAPPATRPPQDNRAGQSPVD
jgi:hypothetical protein